MRVYTNSTLRSVMNYGKALIGLVVLFVLLSQAVKIWGDDPAVREIKNLIQPEQAE